MKSLPSLAMSFIAIACSSTVFGAEASEPKPVQPTALSAESDAVDFDLAKLRAYARVVYVSSGPKTFAVRMIDSDGRTAFRFAADDLHPTVIVQLANSEKLHRVSTIFPSAAARLDVYLTNQLPKNLDDLSFLTPVASIVGPNVDGKAVADFAPQDARYVTLRWTRNGDGGEFKVAEISAFGGGAYAFLDLELITPLPGDPVANLPVIPVVSAH